MATVNGVPQKGSFQSITSTRFVPEQLILGTSAPQRKSDPGFLFDIPWPLSSSAGFGRHDDGGAYPADIGNPRDQVINPRPQEKFRYGMVRSTAGGKPIEDVPTSTKRRRLF